MQVIDVRDPRPAVTCAESRTPGDFPTGSARCCRSGELLAQVAAGVGSSAPLTWVPQEVLTEQGSSPDGPGGAAALASPSRVTTGPAPTTRLPRWPPGWCCARWRTRARDTLAWLRATPAHR